METGDKLILALIESDQFDPKCFEVAVKAGISQDILIRDSYTSLSYTPLVNRIIKVLCQKEYAHDAIKVLLESGYPLLHSHQDRHAHPFHLMAYIFCKEFSSGTRNQERLDQFICALNKNLDLMLKYGLDVQSIRGNASYLCFKSDDEMKASIGDTFQSHFWRAIKYGSSAIDKLSRWFLMSFLSQEKYREHFSPDINHPDTVKAFLEQIALLDHQEKQHEISIEMLHLATSMGMHRSLMMEHSVYQKFSKLVNGTRNRTNISSLLAFEMNDLALSKKLKMTI